MKWFKLKAVPFVRPNISDPWSILLRNNCSIKMIYLHDSNGIATYIAVDDSSNKVLLEELACANYIVEESSRIETSNEVYISRKIDQTNYTCAKYYSIKIDDNGIKGILQYLLDNQSGLCIEINGRHNITKQLTFQINQQKFINAFVCPFLEELPESFNFIIYTFSSSFAVSEDAANKVTSCFEGLQRASITSSVSPFVKELMNISTTIECSFLMALVNQLGSFGVQYNNDTLISQEHNIHKVEIDPEIVIGTNFSGTRKIGLSKKELCQHVFIAGGPGAGKGNLLINLAMEFYHNGVSFLIIESAKNELHHLSKWIPELKVWRPETGKFVINPFFLPDGLDYSEYANNLRDIMFELFNVDPNDNDNALPGLFVDTLKKCSSRFVNNPFKPSQFGLHEFTVEFMNLRKLKKYDKTIEKRLRAAGFNRIESPITNEFVLDSVATVPVKELITGFNVLQLECLRTDTGKSRMAFVLLNQIFAYLQNKGTNDLNLAIIIDESHVLIKNTGDCQIGTYFHKMIDEFRSRGISIIVSDQSANNIPDGIVRDSYTKIFMGGNDTTGIDTFATKAKLDEVAYGNLFSLTSGQGIMISDNNSSGITFVTEDLIKKLDITTNCEFQNSYLINNRITIEAYTECDSCLYKGKCSIDNKVEAHRYAEAFFNLYEELLESTIEVNGECIKIIKGKEHDQRLLKTIREYAATLSDESFGCFLKQVFRVFNINHGNNENIHKYDKLIDIIIKHRNK